MPSKIMALWQYVKPPAGLQVRRSMVVICLAVSMPRILQPTGAHFIFDRLTVGWAFFGLAIALAVTRGKRWRLNWVGRTVAAIGFAVFVTLAWDAWTSSMVSAFISMAFAYTLLGEAMSIDEC